METEIIGFFDNDKSEYPLIEIEKGFYKDLTEKLEEYRKKHIDEYNWDDFISILQEYKWFVREIYKDNEVFF